MFFGNFVDSYYYEKQFKIILLKVIIPPKCFITDPTINLSQNCQGTNPPPPLEHV